VQNKKRQQQEEGTSFGDPSAFWVLSDDHGIVPKRRNLALNGDERGDKGGDEGPMTCLGMFCNDRKVSPGSSEM
jgi:hypothetical protein